MTPDKMTEDQLRGLILKHQTHAPVWVVPIANQMGIQVRKAKRWPDSVSGLIRKEAPTDSRFTHTIWTNSGHALTRRRFTIAHEIAHFVLHRHLIGDGIQDDALYRSELSNTLEWQANHFAAEILMPWHLIDRAMNEGVTSIAGLAEKFKVSESAMHVRLGVPYFSSRG